MLSKNIDFLITPTKLYSLLQSDIKVVVLDVRDKKSFLHSHIIQALNAPEIFTYLPEGITTEEEKKDFCDFFSNLLGNLGISGDELVVFYEDKYTLKSPRGITILKYLGYDENKLKVLEGGLNKWEKTAFPVSTNVNKVPKVNFQANIQEDFFVTYDEMKSFIYDKDVVVLDVRDKDEWLGISSSPYGINFAPKKGRLPNAIWIEWYEFITCDMLEIEQENMIYKTLRQHNIIKSDTIILYCFKGARLSNSYIALRKLGYSNIRIYFAGWNEWCRKKDAPIINEVEHTNNEILKENIFLKEKLDTLMSQNSRLVDFPKFSKEPIFTFNRDGEIDFFNKSKEKNLSTVKSFFDIYPNKTNKDIYNFIDNILEDTITVDEKDKYFLLSLQGSRDLNKILVYAFDITEIFLLNKSLEVEKKKALIATQAKSEFLANMSHEIRTPMNGILGMSHLVLQTNLTNKQKDFIEKIDKSAHSLLGIINDILDFSKIEAGKLEIVKVEFDLFEMVNDVISLIKHDIENKQLDFVLEYDRDIQRFFYADSLRLSQILLNLLSNAVKFTEKGMVSLTISSLSTNKIQFCVKDTGIGLTEEHKGKLFQSFSQADSSITKKFGGTGLGLVISQKLAKLMDGSISFKSKYKQGSAFTLECTLESCSVPKDVQVQEKENKQYIVPNLKNKRILLAEDNNINQEIIVGILEDSYCIIDIANNGKEAIDMFENDNNRYDLILIDVQMPIMDGITATKILRKHNVKIPIIALTANAMKEDIQKTKEAGVNEHLNKPIDIQNFYKVLSSYLLENENDIENKIITTKLTKMQYIDTVKGLQYSANKENLYLKIMKNFFLNFSQINLKSLDEKDLLNTIHTLKGLSGQIGATELYNLCVKFEKKKTLVFLEEVIHNLGLVLQEIDSLNLKEEIKDKSETAQTKQEKYVNSFHKKPSQGKILIVDDLPINIKIVIELLGDSYDIIGRQDGETALEIIQDEKPDLILLDIMMPEMSGIEVCKVLKASSVTKEIPILFLTAKNDEKSIAEAYSLGGSDYIKKPFIPKELCARVKRELELVQLQNKLKLLASTDSMTGLYNRREFMKISSHIFDIAQREKENLSLIMIDIDKFKNINDSYGHNIGDKVIVQFAKLLNKIQRKSDTVCRFGGEEFVVLLPETSLHEAQVVAEKIRDEAQNIQIIIDDSKTFYFTVSLGVTAIENETDFNIEMLINRADTALYDAKNSGRNKFSIA